MSNELAAPYPVEGVENQRADSTLRKQLPNLISLLAILAIGAICSYDSPFMQGLPSPMRL